MNNDDHAKHVASRAHQKILDKYRAGQAEHGGDLSRKDVREHIGEEITDLNVYWETHWDHLESIEYHLRAALANWEGNFGLTATSHIKKALNILTVGNPDGVEEEERG